MSSRSASNHNESKNTETGTRLDHKTYYEVIKHTQLVSTDIYFFHNSKLFLGKRVNEPAKGWLFTPGCRVYKNETLDETCVRLGKEELGINISAKDCTFLGVYDHIYANNFKDNKFGTHYVNIAYMYMLSDEQKDNIKTDDQHTHVEWVHVSNINSHNQIHDLVKKTFSDIVYHLMTSKN